MRVSLLLALLALLCLALVLPASATTADAGSGIGSLEDLLLEGMLELNSRATGIGATKKNGGGADGRSTRPARSAPGTITTGSSSERECNSYRCPLASHVASPRPGHKALSNGCGTAGFRIHSRWHETCCDAHDQCYSTCNKARDTCDTGFQKCMNKQCKRFAKPHQAKERKDCESEQQPSPTLQLLLHCYCECSSYSPVGCAPVSVLVSFCSNQATMFFSATRSLGCQPYLDSQKEACTCTLAEKVAQAAKEGAGALADSLANAADATDDAIRGIKVDL
jgi:hypothetical protein